MRRMLLVPPEGLPSSLTAKLSNLDQQMKVVLDRTDLDERSKLFEYNQILSRYLETKDKINQPIPIPIVDSSNTEQGLANVSRTNREIPLSSFPKKFRGKAELLLDFVKTNPHIDWNERNELVVNNKVVPNTNIIDLLDDLSRPTTRRDPRGIQDFVNTLRNANVPETFIANRHRLEGGPVNRSPLVHTPMAHSRPARYVSEPRTSGTWSNWNDIAEG